MYKRQEFDEVELNHTKIAENTYVFEAKTLLIDFCKVIKEDVSEFEDVKGESESLGGLLLEINSDLPKLGERIIFQRFEFIIEAADNKRILKVKVIIHEESQEEEEDEF